MADALHHLGMGVLDDIGNKGFTLCTIGGIEPYLDQLMVGQCELDFGQYGLGQTGGTDDDNGLAVMGQGA